MTKAELIYAVTGDVERYLQAIKDDKPDHFPDVGKMVEPTDNTKIEELDADYYEDQPKDYTIRAIINKLNEIIRYINK